MADHSERGREVFAEQAWADTYRVLIQSPRAALEVAELELLAVASYLLGDDGGSLTAWEDAHRRYLEAGDRAGAARCSFWLAFCLMMRGQMAHAGGWLSRAGGIIGTDLDCAAAGYLLIPAVLGALEDGDAATARDLAVRAAEIGARFDDRDLAALATLGHGQALVALGEPTAGTARFDEVMLSVSAGDVGPIASGIVYCAVILECMQIFDLARASEWTDALDAWCTVQPDLVPFRGQCLVHRSQLLQAAGNWPEAITAVESACRRLADPPHPALGLARYQEAELHRLAGAFDDAAVAYRRASRDGYQPMPGLAKLELARGHGDAAAASIRRALQETREPLTRPALLAAAVDVFRETRDLGAARTAADELADIAARSPSAVLGAMADQAVGTVLLGEGDPSTALTRLRLAGAVWQRLHMPYEAAVTAVLLGLSCIALGDRASAVLEFDNALETFGELGAGPDLDRVRHLADGFDFGAAAADDGVRALSTRELEVLAHVAAGETNREIATALVISQHTVGRHLENIFAKLGVRGRAAATAHAYEHRLL